MLRGVHIDCRAQKLTASALQDVLADLAGWGYNAILLEYMDAFPFEGKLACLSAPDAYTKEEVIAIRETARSLGIEIIPLVQTFGHLYWVLRHREFVSLAEGFDPEHASDADITNEDGSIKFTTVCPSNQGTIKLIKEMLRQTRAMHPDARYFHIGGDEIKRPSCPVCEERLKTEPLSKVLADHYGAVCDEAISLGVTPVVWCDILLAFPETLDLMKGKVAVMDWDYWSNGEPTKETNLWGIRDLAVGDNKNIAHEPQKWPELQQKLFRPYVFDKEPETFKAFPYTDLLRDLGFEVILGSAARSAGDSFCVPSDIHYPNAAAASDKALASGITGFIVTSWSVRREPWPLTELSLMLAAEHSKGNKDDHKIGLEFAKRHFGVEDEKLAALPALLGNASKAASNGTDVLQALNEKSDFATGNFFAPNYNAGNPTWRIRARNQQIFANKDKFLSGMANLKSVCLEARGMLSEVPDGRYTYLWLWAVDVLELYCDAAKLLTEKKIESAEDLALFLTLMNRISDLSAKTKEIFSQWYTDFTIEGDIQCRFTVLRNALEERIVGID